MAFDFVCLQTVHANRSEAISSSVGARRVTTLRSSRPSRRVSRVWTSTPPVTRLKSRPSGRRASPARRMRRFFFDFRASTAASSKSGATTTSVKISVTARAAAPRVHVLDDGARRLVEVADELPRGVRVNVVVEGHLLAAEHFGPRDAALFACAVERRLLVRVLAVAQLEGAMQIQIYKLGERSFIP